jgi:hypothetical protein
VRASKFPLEQRRELAAQFRAIQGRAAREAFAAELGVSSAVVYSWANKLLGRVRSWGPRDNHALFPGINGTQEPSGRVDEFRLVGKDLHQLDADGAWRPYVPFARLREALPPVVPALTQTEFLADFERLWREQAEQVRPPRRTVHCTECGRAGHNRRGCRERPEQPETSTM